MKNKRGFIAPLLIAIIAIVVVGGGFYSYNKNNTSLLTAPTKENFIASSTITTPKISLSKSDNTSSTTVKTSTTTTIKTQISNEKSDLTASVTSGLSPLTVNFSLLVRHAEMYRIYFGDGEHSFEVSSTTDCSRNSDLVSKGNCYFKTSHTYSNPGIYSVYTSYEGYVCPGTKTICTPPDNQRVTIVVNADINSSQSISVTKTSGVIAQGKKITITWDAKNAPDGSAVVLSLVGSDSLVIAQDLPVKGSYTWTVPGSNCSSDGKKCFGVSDSSEVWKTSPGNYQIFATLYNPKGGLGGGMLVPSTQLKTLAVSSPSDLVITK